MKKRNNIKGTKVWLTLAFFCIISISMPAMGKRVSGKRTTTAQTARNSANTFAKPDFAYPQTVMGNARAEYAKALGAGDGLNAIRAAIQMTVASSEIDADNNVNGNIARFDTLASSLASPWNAMALMCKAQLLNNVYNSRRWVYDQRDIPLADRPADVLEWSGGMFAESVMATVADAAGRISGDVPLAEVAGLLVNTADARRAGMTVMDFIRLKGAEYVGTYATGNEPLRFGDACTVTPADRCAEMRKSLLDKGISTNKEKGNMELEALFACGYYDILSYAPKRKAWLEECYGRYGDTAYGARFVADYARSLYSRNGRETGGKEPTAKAVNDGRRKALEIARGYAAKYPSALGLGEVHDIIEELTSKSVNLSYPEAVLPSTAWKCGLNATGIYSGNLLIYRFPDTFTDGWANYKDMTGKGRLVKKVPFAVGGTAPDIAVDTLAMAGLEPGVYAIYASAGADASGIVSNGTSDISSRTFLVSDISYFMVTDRADGRKRLYVVDASNQAPVQGATVIWTENVYRGTPERQTFTTDADGSVVLPAKNGKVSVRRKGSVAHTSYWNYGAANRDDRNQTCGKLLTDLSIYKPGQEMKFAGVVADRKGNEFRELPGKEVQVILADANGQGVDTLTLVADSFGRVNGKFGIPSSGLLGTWRVRMLSGGRIVADAGFEVADYKAPGFKVTTGKASDNFRLGDVLAIDGTAMTYAGMPVAGAKVKYTVTYTPWLRWWGMCDTEQECYGTTVTDDAGKFAISLPTATLRDTPYAKGLFTLAVEVTAPDGESQKAPVSMFSLVSPYSIRANIPDRMEAGDVTACNVTVNDVTGHPVQKNVYYTITDSTGKEVRKGEFMSGSFKPDFAGMSSGRYRLLFSLSQDMADSEEGANVSSEVILWRRGDRKPPVRTAMWTPERTVDMKPGQTHVSIAAGSSYDNSHIFCVIDDGERIVEKKWVKVSDGMADVRVASPAADKRMFVTLTGMHDFENATAMVTVIPVSQQEKVEIETESFRDRLEPGAKEVWKFRFTTGGRPMADRPAMAVMSNEALNALAPFRWSFNPYGMASWSSSVSLSKRGVGMCRSDFTRIDRMRNKNYRRFLIPSLNTYDRGLFDSGAFYYVYDVQNEVKSTGAVADGAPEEVLASVRTTSRKMAMSAPRMNGAAKGMEDNAESAEEDAEAVNGDYGGAAAAEQQEIRPVECPLAFFMPDLVTDSEGVATLGFEVPQFNGTWQFQIAGYDKEMRGNVKMLTAVAAKKVMVRMNAPRFLRTGDEAQLSATLYNNSGETLPLSGRMVVTDIAGKVLYTLDFAAEEVAASGSRVVTMPFAVPGDMSAVIVKAYASGGGHTDGEGTEVAVLPSSTPVTESAPFYLGTGEQRLDVKMPPKVKDATVTLQYCGNPLWECVTALPAIIKPDSENILAQVNALFGNAIGAGLTSEYPQIAEALRTFAAPENAGDSTLVSHLQRDGQLKIVELGNTPWVNNAADETLRMQSLVKYADTREAQDAVKSVMEVLANRQNNDGGWSWCSGMPTSPYITGRVLLHFAMLEGMGYLPEDGAEMAEKAFAYMDRELVKNWQRSKPRSFSTSELLNYLYVKSFFPDVKDSGGFGQLRAAALKAIAAEWKAFDIYNKATAVTLERRLGNKSIAGAILESVRQYATVTSERGMCFMNLKGSWSGWNPLITTAQVLEAYGEMAKGEPMKYVDEINGLRQWLVMSKQTLDWGAMQGTAEVIQALIATGSDWTVPQVPAVLSIGGNAVELPRRSKLTDSFTVTLTPEQVRNGGIVIEKPSHNPAWGGVVSQYVAPVLEVKSQGVPQLKVEKNIYSVADGKALKGELKVGDKVKVTLTVTTDRDMDYVAIIDGRSACLEPVDQLSGYTSSDGVWFYREVRNTCTNLFIPFLGKGTHVISYECYVDRAGEYTLGIAEAQSQYAPVITAHSAGKILSVDE